MPRLRSVLACALLLGLLTSVVRAPVHSSVRAAAPPLLTLAPNAVVAGTSSLTV